MLNIVGVKFRQSNRVYYFNAGNLTLKKGTFVIVETQGDIAYKSRRLRDVETDKENKHKKMNNIEFAEVCVDSLIISEDIFKGYDEQVSDITRKVIRVATKKDIEQKEFNNLKEKQAFKTFINKAKKHKLPMKLIDVQIAFDFNKIVFLFTSDGRVDFREFVKDLAHIFKTRIELRQVGARDETKALNGIGICGRPLCCSTFLREFKPISVKMAKDQNISLNPTKISGICGRLMCCLTYEQDTYEEFSENLPKTGDTIKTHLGIGEVLSSNLLKGSVKAAVRKNPKDSPTVYFFNINEVEIIERKKVKEEVIDTKGLEDIID